MGVLAWSLPKAEPERKLCVWGFYLIGDHEGAGMKKGKESQGTEAGSREGHCKPVAMKRKKRGMRFFSFPFQRTKKIKRTVGRPEHS